VYPVITCRDCILLNSIYSVERGTKFIFVGVLLYSEVDFIYFSGLKANRNRAEMAYRRMHFPMNEHNGVVTFFA